MARQKSTVLPFKLQATPELLTKNAGLVMLGEFMRGLGLLRRMGAGVGAGEGEGACTGLAGLSQVNARIVAQRLKRGNRVQHTLDIDASQIVAEKAAAKYTYKGALGYMPMVAHLAEAGVVLHEAFRDGNAAPASENLEFIKACEALMPRGHQIRRLRADSAGYQAAIFNHCEKQGIEFAIGGRWNESLRASVAAVPEAQWRRYADCAVAEITHSMNETAFAFRQIVVRRQHQGELFDAQGQPQEARLHTTYTIIASNFADEHSTEDIYLWYCQRGQVSENGIKALKVGFGMERMPCGQRDANAVFFRLGAIAHNVFVLFKTIALDASWQPQVVQTVRWRLFQLAGKVVKSAGGWILKVNQAALALLEQIRQRTQAFVSAPS
jgi:hypothetical protein